MRQPLFCFHFSLLILASLLVLFSSETLWQLIPHEGESIMLADWRQMQEQVRHILLMYFSSLISDVLRLLNAAIVSHFELNQHLFETARRYGYFARGKSLLCGRRGRDGLRSPAGHRPRAAQR